MPEFISYESRNALGVCAEIAQSAKMVIDCMTDSNYMASIVGTLDVLSGAVARETSSLDDQEESKVASGYSVYHVFHNRL